MRISDWSSDVCSSDLERLAFLVAAADKPRSCDGEPDTKRFIVSTELQSGGANDAVSFGERAITVTAVGAAARNANGNLEARYDPQKPELGRASGRERGCHSV